MPQKGWEPSDWSISRLEVHFNKIRSPWTPNKSLVNWPQGSWRKTGRRNIFVNIITPSQAKYFDAILNLKWRPVIVYWRHCVRSRRMKNIGHARDVSPSLALLAFFRALYIFHASTTQTITITELRPSNSASSPVVLGARAIDRVVAPRKPRAIALGSKLL